MKPKFKMAAVFLCVAAGILFFAGFSEQQHKEKTLEESVSAVSAVPIQLGRDSYGLALIDAENQTLWIYEFNHRGQTFDQLRLTAARSFAYDRKLTEWNMGDPTPTQVKKILEAIQTAQQENEHKEDKKIEALEQVLEQD